LLSQLHLTALHHCESAWRTENTGSNPSRSGPHGVARGSTHAVPNPFRNKTRRGHRGAASLFVSRLPCLLIRRVRCSLPPGIAGRATPSAALRQSPRAAPVTGLARSRWPKVILRWVLARSGSVLCRSLLSWARGGSREVQDSLSPGCWALDLVAGAGSAVAGWRRRLHNARRAVGSSCSEALRAHRPMQGLVKIDPLTCGSLRWLSTLADGWLKWAMRVASLRNFRRSRQPGTQRRGVCYSAHTSAIAARGSTHRDQFREARVRQSAGRRVGQNWGKSSIKQGPPSAGAKRLAAA
jgi:hypothetical protein